MMTSICIDDLDNAAFTNGLVEDLSDDELQLTRGGEPVTVTIALVGLGVAAFAAGVALYAAVKN